MTKFLKIATILAVLLGATSGVMTTSAQNNTSVPGCLDDDRPAVSLAGAQAVQAQQPIIIDHTCTDLSKIPDYWIEQAKAQLRLSYGHTSHGSQPVSGMDVLMTDPSNGGLYDFNKNGAIVSNTLSLDDYTPSGDLGHNGDTAWADRTRTYLDSSSGTGSTRNVVVWSWCGGVSDNTEEGINAYLDAMDQLEQDYPDITFVYMTGHLDGTGIDGDLNVYNNQIRDYCIAHNKVLFDFADIESYDPDGNYFLDQGADDGCNYDSGNWANEWCNAHAGDPLCASCSCAHSEALNCNLKARAFWWMLARLAGWDGGVAKEGGAYKTASAPAPAHGQTVTYTIVVHDITTTVHLTDQTPVGLSYVSNTLTATTGAVSDASAPTLTWTGVLTPTPVVTITYAVTVSAVAPQVISNTATVVASGYQSLSSTATIIANGYPAYLPLVARASQASRGNSDFTFAVTADMRSLAGPGKYDTLQYFRGACQAIAALGDVDFMVSPGDIDPPADVYWTITRTLGADYPWYPVAGNHEVETAADVAWLRDYVYGNANPGPPACPTTTYSFDYQNAHFVMLNEYCDAAGAAATDGDVPTYLYDWLADDLNNTTQKYVFVLGHEPAYPQPDADRERMRHAGDSLNEHRVNRDRFWNLLHEKRVTAYICGHTHDYSLVRINGVWQLDAGHARGLADANVPSTFVLVHVHGNSITFETYRDDAAGGHYTLAHSGSLE